MQCHLSSVEKVFLKDLSKISDKSSGAYRRCHFSSGIEKSAEEYLPAEGSLGEPMPTRSDLIEDGLSLESQLPKNFRSINLAKGLQERQLARSSCPKPQHFIMW